MLILIFHHHLAEMSLKSEKRLENLAKKWLINVSQEPDRRNAALDTGTSLKQILIRFQFVPYVSSYLKELKCIKFKLLPNQNLF